MSLHFYTFPVHFFHPPFFGLNNWFRAKTTWGTHPTGFLSSKKWILGCFKIFCEKSWFFGTKIKFFFSLILFVPKPPETHFRHNLQWFLPYKSSKTSKQAQKRHFWLFLVIFGDFHRGLNLSCSASPKCRFRPGMWKYDVWSPPGCPQLIGKPVGHTA